tara:strand:- start:3 stop:368 length:366 start_codon:yes stop_codon:yes gene_type:complete
MSTISHNKYICKGCTKRFIDCKCIDLCDGKFNKTAILMSFLSFGGLSMKKIERERRQYFSDNYDEAKKPKFKVIKKLEDYDTCGETGGHIDDCCGKKVLAEDTMMIDNTSVCVECYEKLEL